jgi:hypothetical protein
MSYGITLLALTRLKVTSWATVTTTSLIIGLIVCFAEILPQTTWYLFPFEYILIEFIDRIIAFFLISLFFNLFTFKHKVK